METRKNKIIWLVLALVVLVFLIWFFSSFKFVLNSGIDPTGLSETEEEKAQAGPVGEVFVLDEETNQEIPLKTAEMPGDIFSTGGVVVEVLDNGIIVLTDGYSFADEESREVSVLFNSATVVTSADRKSKLTGLDGLSLLSPGLSVSVSSNENIRGKIKYEAQIINILP